MAMLKLPSDIWVKPTYQSTYQPIPGSPYAGSDASFAQSDDTDSEQQLLAPPSSLSRSSSPRPSAVLARRDPMLVLILVVSLGSTLALFIAFPFPTTIHVFVALFIGLTSWTALSWARVLAALAGALRPTSTMPRWSTPHLLALVASSILVGYWLTLGFVPPPEALPALASGGVRPRYFIAANLYNNAAILPKWSSELIKLVEHLGPQNTFISIYESNSVDGTQDFLSSFSTDLTHLDVPHRIVSDETPRWWPYETSPERIAFLSAARNKALEPLQSPDDTVRLADWDEFTKVVFLNDIWFSWDAVVRLLATSLDGESGEEGYDLACGMDYAISGLYDTWVSRDVCGTPMRIFWPYVKDPVSIQRLRHEEPFEVSACWNGVVAFPSGPYLYRPPLSDDDWTEDLETSSSAFESPTHAATAHISSATVTKSPIVAHLDGGLRHVTKRGWKMVDNSTFPNSRPSPPLSTPLQFRTSGIDSCDHSECFLFSYDLHRLYTDPSRPPRILMNPTVRTAYNKRWWVWNNVVLRVPVVNWWLVHWSRGVPLDLVDWIWEWGGRRRDYCTWSALATHMPDRCPLLPGAGRRSWEQ